MRPDEWLLPRPRSLRLDAGQVLLPPRLVVAGGDPELLAVELEAWDRDGAADLVIHHEPGGAAESYRLVVAPGRPAIRVVHADEPGLRHALRSLSQLRRAAAPLPALTIDDAPALAWRAAMIDVSRDRVPTLEELRAIVDRVAALKGNALQLYTEHSFAYAGHQPVWRDAGAITPEELRALDQHAAARGVQLVANQNCFGHFERWLAEPAYTALAEWPDAAARLRAGDPLPMSLCAVDPAARELVCALLDQLLPCCRSRLVNIGCDETVELGLGRSAAAVAERGYAAVYAEHVAAVAQHCLAAGRTPQFWADIALEHPSAFDHLPAELQALAWGYEADSDFERWGLLLAERERSWWACPGTSAWRSITGRPDARDGSIRAAVDAAQAFDAEGLMITDWGDCGHRQQWPVTLLGLGSGLAAAWCGTVHHQPAALGRVLFGDPAAASWLDRLADCERPARQTAAHPLRPGLLSNAGLLFSDLHLPLRRRDWEPQVEPWAELVDQLAAVAAQRPSVPDPRLDAELAQVATEACWAAERARRRRLESSGWSAWIAAGQALVDDYRRLWLQRSRPAGVDDSCRWYRAIIREAEAGT